jgi:crotonobetainyl-CoA:carnitine CoA-transferase CaiB-like acyl-CoA transferase
MPEFGAHAMSSPPTTTRGALQAYRVLDLSENPAGQFCGRMLADYGAAVTLVEPPAGSAVRRQGPIDAKDPSGPSTLFFHLNHGKTSLTLDVGQQAGWNILLNLAGQAEIVIVGKGPDRDALQAANPQAIIALVSDFGDDGPLANWQANEMIHLALSGMMNHNGVSAREPLYGCANRASIAAGVAAYVAVLAALFARRRIGSGQHVQVDVAETASSMWYPYPVQHAYNGWLEPRGERGQPLGFVKCRDSWVAFWIHEHHWADATAALGAPELMQEPRFTGAATRQKNWHELVALIQSMVADWTADDFVARWQARDLIVAKAWRATELFHASPHLDARGYWETVPTPHGDRPILGPQIRLSRTPRVVRRGPPDPGNANHDVYASLGLTDAEVEALRRAEVV